MFFAGRDWRRTMKTLKVSQDGRDYEIPELWLVGFQRSGGSLREGLDRWIEQTLLMEVLGREQADGAAPTQADSGCGHDDVPLCPACNFCLDCCDTAEGAERRG